MNQETDFSVARVIEAGNSIMNGAGPIKSIEDVKTIAASDSNAVVVGSITLEKREGNSGITYFMEPDKNYALNSRGMPNRGLSFYRENLSEMSSISHDYKKPLIVSVAGFTPREYAVLAGMTAESRVDGIELNCGCPNVWKQGEQEKILSFDPEGMEEMLELVEYEIGKKMWISIKLSPYSDPVALKTISRLFSKNPMIKAIATSNTFPNGFTFDRGIPAISGSGLAGISGKMLKPIALGQVIQLKSQLPVEISVIGVGGITTRQDVDDFFKVGASAVQVTTAYIDQGPEIFSSLKKVV